MAINGDQTEDEECLHRKLAVFIRMMEFLFGPVTEEYASCSKLINFNGPARAYFCQFIIWLC